MPHHGSRCKGIADRETSGPGADTGVAFRRSMATSLRTSHAIPRPVHRFIRSCKLTRPTLSSGSLWPSLPRVFSRRLLIAASKNQAGRCHLNDQQMRACRARYNPSVVNREKRCQPKNAPIFRTVARWCDENLVWAETHPHSTYSYQTSYMELAGTSAPLGRL